jgi:hypothetical protein
LKAFVRPVKRPKAKALGRRTIVGRLEIETYEEITVDTVDEAIFIFYGYLKSSTLTFSNSPSSVGTTSGETLSAPKLRSFTPQTSVLRVYREGLILNGPTRPLWVSSAKFKPSTIS